MPIDAYARASRRAAAWLRPAMILAAALGCAAPAWAGEGGTVTLDSKNIYFVAGGAILGWFGKLLADIISGRVAARQKFTEEITDQISNLAKQHYWSLANHAGVLAGLLEDYLYRFDYNLLLQFDTAADLQDNLKALAQTFADQTFYSFCRLIWLFDRFQFEGSNTYLLTTDIAGRSSRQLYNSFITTLPESDDANQASLDLAGIIAAMRCKTREKTEAHAGSNEKGEAASGTQDDVTAAEFGMMLTEAGDEYHLALSCEAYREWLAARPDQVMIAAQCLRAYNELLSHELANLYRDWFQHKRNSDLAFADPVAFHKWPNILTEDSVLAISRARSDSELLQALGRGVPSNRTSEKQAPSPQPVTATDLSAARGPADTAAASTEAAGAGAGAT